MHRHIMLRLTLGTALLVAGTTAAAAQARIFPEGTDCSKLVTTQDQTDCRAQLGGSESVLPGANGTGTNQNGTLGPNGSSGQTNGSTSGSGGGNGGASPPGQTGN